MLHILSFFRYQISLSIGCGVSETSKPTNEKSSKKNLSHFCWRRKINFWGKKGALGYVGWLGMRSFFLHKFSPTPSQDTPDRQHCQLTLLSKKKPKRRISPNRTRQWNLVWDYYAAPVVVAAIAMALRLLREKKSSSQTGQESLKILFVFSITWASRGSH